MNIISSLSFIQSVFCAVWESFFGFASLTPPPHIFTCIRAIPNPAKRQPPRTWPKCESLSIFPSVFSLPFYFVECGNCWDILCVFTPSKLLSSPLRSLLEFNPKIIFEHRYLALFPANLSRPLTFYEWESRRKQRFRLKILNVICSPWKNIKKYVLLTVISAKMFLAVNFSPPTHEQTTITANLYSIDSAADSAEKIFHIFIVICMPAFAAVYRVLRIMKIISHVHMSRAACVDAITSWSVLRLLFSLQAHQASQNWIKWWKIHRIHFEKLNFSTWSGRWVSVRQS